MNMKTKKVYLEILRVTAIMLVIYNHTRSYGFLLYQNTDNLLTYYSSLTLSILCKISVPLFFMISGVTLLGKQESVRTVYLKRVLRMVLVILIFTFLQYLRIVRVHPSEGFSLTTYLAYCYSGNIIEPYWFLKSYLSMLLILPILRIVAQNMKAEHYHLLRGIKVMLTAVALVQIYTGYGMNLTFPMNTDFIFYPLLGYFLANREESPAGTGRQRQLLWAGAAVGLLVLNVIVVAVHFKRSDQYSDALNTVFCWMLTLLVFLIFGGIRVKSERMGRFWIALGECTFGVYLIEDVVRNQVEKWMPRITEIFGAMTSCLIFVLFSTVIGLAVIWLVRKVPCVKRLI